MILGSTSVKIHASKPAPCSGGPTQPTPHRCATNHCAHGLGGALQAEIIWEATGLAAATTKIHNMKKM